jgi:hypothetical protein
MVVFPLGSWLEVAGGPGEANAALQQKWRSMLQCERDAREKPRHMEIF